MVTSQKISIDWWWEGSKRKFNGVKEELYQGGRVVVAII